MPQALTYPHVPPRGILQDADVEVVRGQVLPQAHRLIVGERTFRHQKQTVQLVVNVTTRLGQPTATLGRPENAAVAVVQTATVRDDGRSSSGAPTGRVPPAEVRTVPAADQPVVVVAAGTAGDGGSVGLSGGATCTEAAYLDRHVVTVVVVVVLLMMMMVRSCTEIGSCATFH